MKNNIAHIKTILNKSSIKLIFYYNTARLIQILDNRDTLRNLILNGNTCNKLYIWINGKLKYHGHWTNRQSSLILTRLSPHLDCRDPTI